MNTKFVAEIGSNHNQDWKRCKQLIEAAAKANFWGVKFQLFDPETLYAPGYGNIHDLYQKALPLSWLPKIKKLCNEKKLQFGCTPFDLQAVEPLAPFVDYYKISSFDVNRMKLLRKINVYADGKLTTMLSTGLANIPDIQTAMNIFKGNLFVMECTSKYPAALKETNIHRINNVDHFAENGFWIEGYSDHTHDANAIAYAVGRNAEIIEIHFDLDDQKGFESKHGHCWTAREAKNLINNMRPTMFDVAYYYEQRTEKEYFPRLDEYHKKADPVDGMRPHRCVRSDLTV